MDLIYLILNYKSFVLNFFYSDVLAFVKPHLKSTDNINMPEYWCIHRTDCSAGRNSEGSVIFIKDHVHQLDNVSERNLEHSIPTIVKHNSSCGHFLIIHFRVLDTNMIIAYKSPQYLNSLFIKALDDTLRSIHGNVVVLGDFNMDLRNSEGKRVLQLLNSQQLESKFNAESVLTDGGTHIDYCFSNVPDVEAWLYETYYSYHKAICVVIPKN